MLLLALLLPAYATDADPFTQAASLPTKLGSLQGEAPQLSEAGFSGGISIGMATNTVVRSFEDGRPDQPEVTLMAPVTVHGGYTVEGIARFDVVMPVYAAVDAPINDFSGPAAGDLRLQATIPLIDDGIAQFGLIPRLELPTGSADAVVTEGIAATLIAAVGLDGERMGWVINAGPTLARSSQLEPGAPATGSSLGGLASGWLHVSPSMRVGAEVDASTALVRGDGADRTNANGGAHLFAQEVLSNGFGIAAGVGTGIVRGIGSPGARGFLQISYARLTRDTDADGIVDDADACPREPEDMDGFEDADGCPELDNDSDGVLDVADQCALVAEDRDGFADDDGCPDPDNDGDSILDGDDACPMQPGTADLKGCPDTDADGIGDAADACPTEAGPKELNGCPDRDGDLVPDMRDACPDEPKPVEEDPATSDGCPKIAYVRGGEVTISERVEFDTGKSTIRPESERILEAVAAVVKSTPRILRLEVQGHTDNVGSTSSNQRLSEDRAKAVRLWLTEHGVPGRKLAAAGYGESMPMDSNRTPKGRENNRRVQFKILEMAPVPAAPPSPPSAPPAAPPPPEPEPAGSPWGATEEAESPWGASGDE